MIEYWKGAYGFNLLFRIHGSAAFRSWLPGLFSVVMYWYLREFYRLNYKSEEDKNGDAGDQLEHPYAVGVLVTSVSFLIIFRANHGYLRYWEGCTTVHHMMSKWLDATVHTACFHMQCSHYDAIKPPNYFSHPELLGRHPRDRGVFLNDHSINSVKERRKLKYTKKKLELLNNKGVAQSPIDVLNDDNCEDSLCARSRLDGGWGLLFDEEEKYNILSSPHNNENVNESWASQRTPSLFLQELAHLSSLMVAVAFCTLRNDKEGSESPIDTYIPQRGSKFTWPPVDQDKIPVHDLEGSKNRCMRNFLYWFGVERNSNIRTKYNSLRPMLVLGGVSENEIIALQKAKGASAKVTLAWMWLSEFLTREHLAGSTGKVGPPIISRLFQFLSDGMIYYNHARKIMFIPFPFPHAQISAIYIFVIICAVPLMIEQYTSNAAIGIFLTFSTVTCLVGLHEVARELENPFKNVPNDIPLCTLLAMYNESLISMCSGFHPDFYWEEPLHQTEMKSVQGAIKSFSSSQSNEVKIMQIQIKQLVDLVHQQSNEIRDLKEAVTS